MISIIRSQSQIPTVNGNEKRRVTFTTVKKASRCTSLTPVFETAGKNLMLNSITKSTLRRSKTTSHRPKRKFGALETNSSYKCINKRIREAGTAIKPVRPKFFLDAPELQLTQKKRTIKETQFTPAKKKVTLVLPEEDSELMSDVPDVETGKRTWEIPAGLPSPLANYKIADLDRARPNIPAVFTNASPQAGYKAPGHELDMSLESFPCESRSRSPSISHCDSLSKSGSLSPYLPSDTSQESDGMFSIVSYESFGSETSDLSEHSDH